jgi:molecular chaperone HscC
MQSLKYYPREDMANQRLLRAAERMVGEVSPYSRDHLESAIDMFESAMQSGDREAVEYARNTLGMVLTSLGFALEDGDE